MALLNDSFALVDSEAMEFSHRRGTIFRCATITSFSQTSGLIVVGWFETYLKEDFAVLTKSEKSGELGRFVSKY